VSRQLHHLDQDFQPNPSLFAQESLHPILYVLLLKMLPPPLPLLLLEKLVVVELLLFFLFSTVKVAV
jgi:hypothetical protein